MAGNRKTADRDGHRADTNRQIEQHARHLPLDVDNVIATGLADWVARETYHAAGPVVAPTIAFGYSDLPSFSRFPGTLTIEPETLIDLYRDVAVSLIGMVFVRSSSSASHCRGLN